MVNLLQSKKGTAFEEIKLDVIFHTSKPSTVGIWNRDLRWDYYVGEFGFMFDSKIGLNRVAIDAKKSWETEGLHRKDAKMEVAWEDDTKILLGWSAVGREA